MPRYIRLTRLIFIFPGQMMRFFIIFLLSAFSAYGQSPPDLIIVNANIRTMDKTNPHVEAVAVAGGRILAVGTTEEIRKLAGENSRTIDAQGRLVVPGFNDAHAHIIALGNSFSSLDLSEAKTADDVIARLTHFVRFLPRGRWVLGSKLDPALELSLSKIDSATPGNPVFVYHTDPRSGLVNSLALSAAGVEDKSTTVSDARLAAVQRVVPRDHVRDLPAIIETASNYAASFGIRV